MPSLACRTCGRRIYATGSLAELLPEERRCPRRGALMYEERREYQRRQVVRRQNPWLDPGPPSEGERRGGDRRSGDDRRRQA